MFLNKLRICSSLCIVILLTLVLLHLFVTIWWLRTDNQLPFFDPAFHYLHSSEYGEIFLKPSLNSFYQLIKMGGAWPPLTRLMTGPLIHIFNLDINSVVILMNIIFMPILTFSFYKIGQKLSNSSAGLFAAFLVAVYPIMIGFTRHFNLDLPLIAMLSLAFYYLLKTDNFINRKYSIIFGISVGLGLLTKHAFFIFIAPMVLCASLYLRNLKSIINVILSVLIAGFIAGPWYILSKGPHFDYFRYMHNIGGDILFQLPHTTFDYYILEFINRQASFVFFLIFLMSLVIFIFRYKNLRYKILIIVWILWTYFIFTSPIITTRANVRYTAPILIPITLIISTGLCSIKKIFLQRLMICLTITYALFQYIACTIEIPFIPKRMSINLFNREVALFAQSSFIDLAFNTRPVNSSFHKKSVKAIFDRIETEEKSNREKDPFCILLVSLHPPVNIGTFRYYNEINKNGFSLEEIFDYDQLGYEDIIHMLQDKKYRYLIYTTYSEYLGLDSRYRDVKDAAYQWITAHPQSYVVAYQYLLPDNRKIIIYRHQ